METAANTLLGKHIEDSLAKNKAIDQSQNGLDHFLDEFMSNRVIKLYTEDAPQYILDLIWIVTYSTVAGFFLVKE